MYYYSTNIDSFQDLKNIYGMKNIKFFHFFIAQFNYWQ